MLQQNRDENDWEPAPVFYSFLCSCSGNQPPLHTSFGMGVYISPVFLVFHKYFAVYFLVTQICSYICRYVYIYICVYMYIHSYSYRHSAYIFKYCFIFLHMNMPWFLLILSHNKSCRVFPGFLVCCLPWQRVLQKACMWGLLAVCQCAVTFRASVAECLTGPASTRKGFFWLIA